jgi:hypothetical protein
MIMIHPTIETLRRLRLTGMAKALEEQQGLPDCDRLSFDERLAMLRVSSEPVSEAKFPASWENTGNFRNYVADTPQPKKGGGGTSRNCPCL